MKFVVVIPAFEPNDALIAVVEGLRGEGLGRVVVVDDGSSPVAQPVFARVAAMPECTLLRHPVNRGKGAALKTAFRHVLESMPEAEAVVTVDADGQHAPEDCRRMAEAMANAGAHSYCLGMRSFPLESTPFRSWWGNRWSTLGFALLFRRWVVDTQTGLRAFRRELLAFFLDLPGEGYEYEMCCLGMAARAKCELRKVGVRTIYEPGNASSHFKALRDTWRIYRAMFLALMIPLKRKGVQNEG